MPVCNCHIQGCFPAAVSVEVLLNDSVLLTVPSLLPVSTQAEKFSSLLAQCLLRSTLFAFAFEWMASTSHVSCSFNP